MTLLEPSLPAGAKLVYSALYDTLAPECLTQDMLLVQLADGSFVDLTWSPEHDPDGQFYVIHLQGWQSCVVGTCVRPRDALAAVERYAALVDRLSRSESQ